MFDDVRRGDVRARLLARNGAARLSALSLTRSERRTVARMLAEKALTSHPDHVVSLPSAKAFVITCRRLGGVVSCGHAMKHYGIPLRTSPGVLHVAIPAQRSRVPDAIGRTVVHRVRGLALPEDTQPPVAQVEQALICFMRCAKELDALIALDAALRLGYTTRSQLESALPGPRNAPLRSLLSQARPGARSLLETIARHDLERVTITRPGSPEPQVITMARREPISTLNEELRRLTPDLVYQEVLATLLEEPVND